MNQAGELCCAHWPESLFNLSSTLFKSSGESIANLCTKRERSAALVWKTSATDGRLRPFNGAGSTCTVAGKRKLLLCDVSGTIKISGERCPYSASWITMAGRCPPCSCPAINGNATDQTSPRFIATPNLPVYPIVPCLRPRPDPKH